jgi:hypothetical protein
MVARKPAVGCRESEDVSILEPHHLLFLHWDSEHVREL